MWFAEAYYLALYNIRSKSYGSYTGCCGSSTYDTRLYFCCNGVPRSKLSRYWQCCGTRPYNPRTHVCCSGVARRKTYGSSTGCCGCGVYRSVLYINICTSTFKYSHNRTKNFTIKGFTWRGRARSFVQRKSPSWVQGQSLVGGLGNEVLRSWIKMWNLCTIFNVIL